MIPPLPPIAAASITQASAAGTAASGTAGTSAASGASGEFSNLLGQAIDNLNGVAQNAQTLAVEGATGQANIADVTVAATQAQLDVSLVTAVRDKAVAAFNSIMSMPA